MNEACPATALIQRVEVLEGRFDTLESTQADFRTETLRRMGHLETNIVSLREEVTVNLVQIVASMEKRIMGKLDILLKSRGNSK